MRAGLSGGRVAVLAGLAAAAAAALWLYGPMPQDAVAPGYHDFADRRTVLGVPNFWNVVTNLPFLVVAVAGRRALRRKTAFLEEWERRAYVILLLGLALISAGSAWYHFLPSTATLFWDRLPMALAFTAILAATIGERIGLRAGRLLLWPLLAAGAASVLYWRAADDLRPYLLVQFYAVAGLPLMLLLFPARYTGSAGIWAMCGLYGAALLLDHFDRQAGALLATGGHPWKHVAAALGMLCYVLTIGRRRPILLR